MPKGLITSLLIKLTLDFWYFSLFAVLIKFFLIRFTAAENYFKTFLVWFIGSITFYCIACLTGIIFSSMSFDMTPFVMFLLACGGELAFTTIMFRIPGRKILPSIVISNGMFFLLIFTQALRLYR